MTYEQDIAPLTRRFFADVTRGVRGSSALSPRMGLAPGAAIAVSDQFTQSMQDIYKSRTEFQRAEQETRMRQLQHDNLAMSLDAAREESARRREMLGQLGGLQLEIDSVLTAPDLTPEERTRELGRVGVRYADAIGGNPAGRAAFDAARLALPRDTPVQERAPRLTVGYFVTSGGRIEDIRKDLPEDFAWSEETPLPPEVFGRGLSIAQGRSSEAKALLEKSEKDREERNRMFEGVLRRVEKVKLPDSADGLSAAGAFMSPDDKAAALFAVAELGDATEAAAAEAGTLTDAELVSLATNLMLQYRAGNITRRDRVSEKKSAILDAYRRPAT
jgi:hypothetical protein